MAAAAARLTVSDRNTTAAWFTVVLENGGPGRRASTEPQQRLSPWWERDRCGEFTRLSARLFPTFLDFCHRPKRRNVRFGFALKGHWPASASDPKQTNFGFDTEQRRNPILVVRVRRFVTVQAEAPMGHVRRLKNKFLDAFESDYVNLTKYFSLGITKRVKEPITVNYSYAGEINLSFRLNLDNFREIVRLFNSVISGGYIDSLSNSISIESNRGVMNVGIHLNDGCMRIIFEADGYDAMCDVIKFNSSREIYEKLESAFDLLKRR